MPKLNLFLSSNNSHISDSCELLRKDIGLIRFVDKLKVNNSTRLDIVQFAQGDIERHEAVKEVLKIYGDT